MLVRATYMYGAVLHAHPVRGESHNQRNTTGEIATEGSPAGYTHGSGLEVDPSPGGGIASLTLFGQVLVWSQQNYPRLLLTARYFGSP